MKVVVSHVYSNDNAGDAALLSVLIGDLRAVWPDVEIVVLTMDRTDRDEHFEGCRVYPSFMFHAFGRFRSKPLKFAHAGWVIAATLLSALPEGRWHLGADLSGVMSSYRDADLVVGVGGGYLRGKPGLASTTALALLLHPLLLTRLLGKPAVLYTQSIGPFGNRLQAALASRALRGVDLIVAREDLTVSTLAELGVTANVVRSVDGAFGFTTGETVNLRYLIGVSGDGLVVGVTVRDWLPSAGQDRYERAVAQLCDWVIGRYGAAVVFIPQVTNEYHGDDDRVPARRVAERMRRDAIVLDGHYDHRTMKALYGELDVLVGTRFHSVIFALTAGVPAIAIEYEYKTRGIMGDLGLERWVIDITAVDGSSLIERFDALAATRADYIAHLKVRLPPYIDRARQTRYHLLRFRAIVAT